MWKKQKYKQIKPKFLDETQAKDCRNNNTFQISVPEICCHWKTAMPPLNKNYNKRSYLLKVQID